MRLWIKKRRLLVKISLTNYYNTIKKKLKKIVKILGEQKEGSDEMFGYLDRIESGAFQQVIRYDP